MQLFTLATVLLTTGLSVTASPFAMPLAAVPAVVADPVVAPAHPLYDLQPFASRALHGSGRRLSRKVRRHGHHHGHHQGTNSSDVPAASATGSCTDESGDTTTIIEYTTITSGVDQPTSTDTDSAPAETTPADSSSSDSSAPTDSSSTDSDTPSSTDSAPQPTQTGNGGVIQAHSAQCGDPNGTADPTQTGGPNGDENWLNCGVNGDGWVPPPVTLDNLVYKDLATVLQQDNNPFIACTPYLSMFQNMSDETGVPTIFLASIALQESGCQPGVTGGAGEIGMMQITGEKCPTDGSDCYDPMTNIRIGSQYFKTTLDANNGNLAATMGDYNGWVPGLTATAASANPDCAEHNNLNYLQNVFNGFIQGVSPDSLKMGIYHNTCPSDGSK